tara:strand:+ start:940 stop:1152 length:213 start_codon:yes stop_codon:yes gene_type:complete
MEDQIKATPPEGRTVKIFFDNGKQLDFTGCTDISEPPASEGEGKIIFTSGGAKYVFQKGKIAGWSISEAP